MTSAAPIDLARALDEGAWSPFHKQVLLLAALAFAVDGFANQVLGMAIPAMVKDWDVAREAFAPVLALGLVGLAIGTITGGMLGDRIGRRPTLIGAIILFGSATALVALTDSIGQLAAVRFIDGLGLGAAIPNATSIVAEFTPARRRSFAISIGMVFIPFGGILAGAAAAALLPAEGWRALFITAGGCALAVAAVLAMAIPESPRFLLRLPERREELQRLARRLGIGAADDAAFLPDQSERTLSAPIALLFEPGLRRDTFALWGAFFCCLLSTYTVQSWGPSAFTAAGIGIGSVGGIMAGFGFGGIAGSLLAGAMMDHVGSRRTIATCAAAAVAVAICVASVSLDTVSTPLLALAIGLLGGALSGVQTPLYALAAHIYVPRCRATGVGMASAMGRVGAMASSFTGVATLDILGPRGFFLFLGGVVTLCVVAMLAIRHHIAPRDLSSGAGDR